MNRTLVFIHGSGRAGSAAWPNQVEHFADAVYLTMPGYGDEAPVATNIDTWVNRILERNGELDLVAHSYGGLAAIYAAARASERVRSLILFEPAAYSYTRGQPGAERQIERMAPVVAQAPSMDAADYEVAFMAALTGSRPSRPSGPEELRAAERNRLLAPPWSFDLPVEVLSAVPTLVLTGHWNDEYEEIGQAMEAVGARHVELPGFGHRVQDHPEANVAISKWISAKS